MTRPKKTRKDRTVRRMHVQFPVIVSLTGSFLAHLVGTALQGNSFIIYWYTHFVHSIQPSTAKGEQQLATCLSRASATIRLGVASSSMARVSHSFQLFTPKAPELF